MRIALLLGLSLSVAIAAPTSPSVNQAPRDARVSEAQAKLDALKREINAVNAVLDEKTQVLDQSTQSLRLADLAIADSAKKIYQLRQVAAGANLELEALTLQSIELSANLTLERNRLRQLLRSAYALGQMEQVKLALSQEKVALVGRVLAYHQYINKARIESIAEIQASLAGLQSLREQIYSKHKQIEGLIAEQARSVEQLQTQRLERQAVIAQLNQELSVGGEKLEQLRDDQDRVNELLSRITDVLADIPKILPNARQLLPGRLIWPLRQFEIARGFGSPHSRTGRASNGLYLKANLASEVTTVGRGRVAFAQWLRGFGLLVIVDHGDGLMSLYGHLESVLVGEGEWLDAETVLGTSGTLVDEQNVLDGLYFEIREQGRAQNPNRWLKVR